MNGVTQKPEDFGSCVVPPEADGRQLRFHLWCLLKLSDFYGVEGNCLWLHRMQKILVVDKQRYRSATMAHLKNFIFSISINIRDLMLILYAFAFQWLNFCNPFKRRPRAIPWEKNSWERLHKAYVLNSSQSLDPAWSLKYQCCPSSPCWRGTVPRPCRTPGPRLR